MKYFIYPSLMLSILNLEGGHTRKLHNQHRYLIQAQNQSHINSGIRKIKKAANQRLSLEPKIIKGASLIDQSILSSPDKIINARLGIQDIKIQLLLLNRLLTKAKNKFNNLQSEEFITSYTFFLLADLKKEQ